MFSRETFALSFAVLSRDDEFFTCDACECLSDVIIGSGHARVSLLVCFVCGARTECLSKTLKLNAFEGEGKGGGCRVEAEGAFEA